MAPFRQMPDTVALRTPSVVVAGDTTIVAGNHFPSDVDRVAARRRLVIARSPGGMLPIPDGSFDFAFPQLVRDARGTLHLVWAEFADSSGSLAAWMSPPTSLWHSSFRNGRWSTPRKIFAGRRLNWSGDGRAVTSDAAGNIHIVAPALPTDGPFAVVHLRIEPNGAVTERALTPGASHASITRLSRDSLVIASSTSDSLTPKGGSSILLRVSPDGGRSWAEPLAIVRSERRNASPPLVEPTPAGLDAVWIEESRTPSGGRVLRRFSARSPSAPWHEKTPAVSVDGTPVRLVSAAACGAYALIVETLGGSMNDPTIRLVAIGVRDDRVEVTPLLPELDGAMAVGVGAEREGFRLVFSAVRHGELRAVPATTTGRVCRTM